MSILRAPSRRRGGDNQRNSKGRELLFFLVSVLCVLHKGLPICNFVNRSSGIRSQVLNLLGNGITNDRLKIVVARVSFSCFASASARTSAR